MSNVKKNFIYNIIYQILVLIIPLITMPYVSRILGSDGIGTYSYTYSIVYYFMIFSMLGLNNYGNRSIAKVRDDKKKLSQTFREIHLLQIITTFVMIVIYVLFLFIVRKYSFILLLQSLYLISCMFDINWFFFGIEKFKLTVTRNTIIKILSLILIFIIVKNKGDVWKYTLILSFSTLLSQILLWPFVKKYIFPVKIKVADMKKHFVPCLKLFLPVIAVAIYKVMDKTMLGFMASVGDVGFYENAEKILNMPNSIIAALGTVMLPRMSNLYSKGEDEKCKRTILVSIKLMMFLAIGMTFGIIGVGKCFAILFFGNDFRKTGDLLVYLSVTILFLSWGNVIRTQYLIPKEKDREYIISAFLGAGINFILNIIFIQKYGASGACIGTIAAEFFVMLYQTFAVKKELPVGKYIKEVFPFFIKGIIMLLCIYPLNNINLSPIIRLILQVLIGGSIYCILNIKYILSVIDLNKVLKKLGVKKNKYVLEDIDNDGSLDVVPIPTIKEDNIISSNSINEKESILPKEDIIPKKEIYTDRESLSNAIRNDNSYIKNIDFNYHYNFDIIDLILEEIKIYNYKFNNEDYLRNGKYPIILSNNHSFMKYVIDKDFNNIFYIDSFNMDKNEINGIINYTFKKVYALKEKDKNITFNLDKFKNSDIVNNNYFQECLRYLK